MPLNTVFTYTIGIITYTVGKVHFRNTTIRQHSNGFVQKQYVTKYLLCVWSLGFLWVLSPWLSALVAMPFTTHGPMCAPAPDSFALPFAFLFFFVALPVGTKTVAYIKVFHSVTIASCRVRYSRSSLMTLAIRVSRASQASGLSHKISQLSTPSVVSNANDQIVRQQSASSLSGLPAQERRLAFAMFAMVFLSLVTWCPLGFAFFLHAARHPLAIRFLTWSLLTSLTCAIHNPLIYIVCNRKFRKVFVSHFLCRCRCHSNAIEAIELQHSKSKAGGGSTERPEPRWLFSGPALATINETGSHIALAGSKHDSDSGYILNSSSSNLAVVKAPPDEPNEQLSGVDPKEHFSNLTEKQRQRKRPVVTQDAMLPPVNT
ncbi:hypothetical protein CAPTEDRAFT_188151 [Capitella teleta]|uniref:G-protein coupled receptors family 1 profile domain-containing protein n=1 Tax=Capitella teleta TaxID=283909 RepID=R7V8I1_CAPTE|nr:hypothetical protein CAPTEDRAFT_188151 [Capitella teleta]|eukprot:ELU12065.1 hypothetical protein CAPTEDRAFT_188151 [Capitella teleta]